MDEVLGPSLYFADFVQELPRVGIVPALRDVFQDSTGGLKLDGEPEDGV